MPAAVRPERILKDLARLWVDLAKEDTEKNAAGVLRACAMTLIVGVEETQDTMEVGETIAELIHDHPSRAIVVRVQDENTDAPADMDARVFAQCWMPFGKRQQICCEQIEIMAPQRLLADVRKVMLGVTVPDLPVVLWIRSGQLALNAEFQQLFSLANKIIIDTDRFPSPDEAYAYIERNNRAGRNMTDLAWTRLTHWRQQVAQICENELCRRKLAAVQRVVISHTPQYIPVAARYLTAWFRHALPLAAVEFKPSGNSGPPAITGIALSGPELNVSITLDDASSALLDINGLTRRAAFPVLTEHALMREELSILGPDPVFRRCFE